MDADAPPQQEREADGLLELVKGPLAASAARLSAHSRDLPSGRDFHFYRSFDQFRSPAREIAARSESLLSSLGSSPSLSSGGRRQPQALLLPEDLDDAHDWVVNLNDGILERFSASMDEFKSSREEEEKGGAGRDRNRVADMEGGGFQMVYGKKGRKKKDAAAADGADEGGVEAGGGAFAVKVASRDKKAMGPRPQVPFHIPTIPRPQDVFKILVNNSNQPFEHVWLERSEDGSRFVHPLEKLSVLDFVDGNIGEDEPVKPPSIENTPCKLVEGVKELKELAAKLRNVDEFAVDLEHNHYRSFQGLTCLMQISTRAEDFIVDTLKLRIHVGPHLRELFKDPSKRKVMHGADRDILWLQRDFGIYVCNLFDTGQASRILQLERNSLEFLLHYFCGFTANKEYQQADWRLRPLPDDMLKYAREDTHYLLYIYDIMKRRLVSELSKSELGDSQLAEVYKRSYDVCMQLYEKELLTDASYLRIYGLNEANFNSQQLAVVVGLYEWRDKFARAEDESTGYILPNKTLLEIARQMPLTSGTLRRLIKSRHPNVDRLAGSVVGVIRNSIGNAASFEIVSEQLKKGHLEAAADEGVNDDVESPPVRGEHASAEAGTSQIEIVDGADSLGRTEEAETSVVHRVGDPKPGSSSVTGSPIEPCIRVAISSEEKMGHGLVLPLQSVKAVNVASIQVLKKPTGAFGALFWNSSNKRKLDPDPKGRKVERDKADVKLEQIKSSVTLPFHSFAGSVGESRFGSDRAMTHAKPQHPEPLTHQELEQRLDVKVEDIIALTNESEDPQSSPETPSGGDSSRHRGWFPELLQNGSAAGSGVEMNMTVEPMSLAELSSSFRKCLPTEQTRRRKDIQKEGTVVPLQPFDYAAGRKEVRFGDGQDRQSLAEDDDSLRASISVKGRRKGSAPGRVRGEERADFQPPRRCQAFPASGNRSATFH